MKQYEVYRYFSLHLEDEFRVTIFTKRRENFSVSGTGRSLALLAFTLPASCTYDVNSRISKCYEKNTCLSK